MHLKPTKQVPVEKDVSCEEDIISCSSKHFTPNHKDNVSRKISPPTQQACKKMLSLKQDRHCIGSVSKSSFVLEGFILFFKKTCAV